MDTQNIKFMTMSTFKPRFILIGHSDIKFPEVNIRQVPYEQTGVHIV